MTHYKMAWAYVLLALVSLWRLPADVRVLVWVPIILALANAYYVYVAKHET